MQEGWSGSDREQGQNRRARVAALGYYPPSRANGGVRLSIRGVNMPQVKEIQKYTKSDSVFTIHSKLSINLVGATAVFSGDTILSPDGEGRCAVNVNLTLDVRSAMQGWVESYMEREAEASFKTWMNIARVFCEEKMDLAKGSLLNHDFYDINGTALDNTPPPAKVGQVPHISSSRPTESVSWPQVLSHLRRLDEKVLKLERDLFLLRSSLKSQMSKAWSIYGLGTATGLALCFLYLLKREKRT